MNRRSLVALALALPLAIFGVAKTMASWRPVALTHLTYGKFGFVAMRAGERLISADDEKFDLQTGALTSSTDPIVGVDALTWRLQPRPSGRAAQLFLETQTQAQTQSQAQPARVYELTDVYTRGEGAAPLVRMRPDADCVEMLLGQNYYRWRAKSGQLERHTVFPVTESYERTLAPDGERVIYVDNRNISALSTRTGRIESVTPLRGFKSATLYWISPLGRYALYEVPDEQIRKYRVVDTTSGRALWILMMPLDNAQTVFSPDETEIAVPQIKRRVWEIHDLPTGKILRTLPLLPDALGGAYAPDGATLYSVAAGVLYRQRAR